MLDRKGTNVTLDRIFEEMYTLISESNRIPLTDKIIIEESDLAGVLDDLKDAIPKEVKSASQVLEEQKTIVSNAREEAEAIVEQAKAEADRILTMANGEAERIMREEEIVKQAESFADEVRTEALRYRDEVKSEADVYGSTVKTEALQYAEDMLGYLSTNMQSALDALGDNYNRISAERKNLEVPITPAIDAELSDENVEEMDEE